MPSSSHHAQLPPTSAAAPPTTLSCRPPEDEVVRCAIAVHNIGCALLEAEQYDDAHSTLTDAARALATLFGNDDSCGDRRGNESNDGCGDDRTSLRSEVVASMLAAANQRLASPRQSVVRVPRFNSLPSLRIEVEQLDDDDAPCLAVMTAISLHNFGVSCFYRSIAHDGNEAQLYLQTKAILLLQASYTLLMDCGLRIPSTLGYALHVLENLVVSSRLHAMAWQPSAHGEPQLVPATTTAAAVQDELAWLRATVQSFEAADVNVLGRSVLAAAA